MNARLFCHHCNKYYEVNLEHIRMMQRYKSDTLTFAHNTYFYKTNGCFFKTLKEVKEKIQIA